MTSDLDLLLDGPAHELAAAVSARRFTARHVAEASLARAGKSRDLHGSFLHVSPAARSRAGGRGDRRVASGEATPLAGVPLAVKDNVIVAGLPSTAGSRILSGFVAADDATCVARLVAAGAVVVGKTSCDEFGMGSSNESSAFGPVRNPWDTSRVPGGSSGGSAAAVAALAVPLAIGTDTGGSVRQPAAFCSLVGVKPTYGRVSRYGLIAYASSLDQAGLLARTVDDVAVAFVAISGADPRDSTSLGTGRPTFSRGSRPESPGCGSAFSRRPTRPRGDSTPRRRRSSERPRSSNGRGHARPRLGASRLARGGGVLHGRDGRGLLQPRPLRRRSVRRAAGGRRPAGLYRATRTAGFGPEVKRRILLGTFALSSGYREAWYERAQRVRALLAIDFAEAFRSCDAILCPTAPGPAFRIGEKSADPLAMYLADVFTVPASLAGLPALSVPAGLSRERLPIGMQLPARRAPSPCSSRWAARSSGRRVSGAARRAQSVDEGAVAVALLLLPLSLAGEEARRVVVSDDFTAVLDEGADPGRGAPGRG